MTMKTIKKSTQIRFASLAVSAAIIAIAVGLPEKFLDKSWSIVVTTSVCSTVLSFQRYIILFEFRVAERERIK